VPNLNQQPDHQRQHQQCSQGPQRQQHHLLHIKRLNADFGALLSQACC
jgi:hypothetical protein